MNKFDFIENDKRIIEQRLKRHQLSHSEYQKLLKGLPEEKEEAGELAVFKKGGDHEEKGRGDS